tara:strand:- start:27617 stop:28315 length:699 start_codon:yes stop_codon:yes gene_type:complete
MRTRAKKKKNNYFTKVHEEAIIQYARTDCIKVRTELYVSLIQPALDEMVNKIIFTYKFTNIPNIDSLREECKVWLTTILDKYNPDKGSKAFSYFSVVTKNWFIHKIKKNSKKAKTEVSYEDMVEKGVLESKVQMNLENTYLKDREDQEFWFELMKNLDKWETVMLKPNEKKVLLAVRHLIDNIDNIEIFNKKAIYLYLREITGLNTKQVVNNLNKIRDKYKLFKIKWERGEI